ncbi:MAG TPA: DNRLRE domain-containing protein [Peptococcaceae bacterium]|nr:DNRLRE domain-containing protein [Peptococcaceae bacterium]
MVSIDIIAEKSLTISTIPLTPKDNDLIIGRCLMIYYISYLYFPLPPVSANSIENARLVLFKTGEFLNGLKTKEAIDIYPLLDYFSSRTAMHNRPKYDPSLTQGDITEGTVSIEIDLTNIVTSWAKGNLINKGIVLSKRQQYSGFSRFGSALTKDPTLKPVLRILCKEPHLPFLDLQCSYKIIPSKTD